jgi:hypothetical protein
MIFVAQHTLAHAPTNDGANHGGSFFAVAAANGAAQRPASNGTQYLFCGRILLG